MAKTDTGKDWISQSAERVVLQAYPQTDTLICKNKNMKKYLINAAIWYVLLSAGMAIVWILTGITGFIPVRIIIALVLAYVKPFDGMPWKQS